MTPVAVNNKVAAGGVFALVVVMAGWFIQPQEGTVPTGYQDLVGVVTACTGHTEPGLEVGKTYSPAQCADWFRSDVGKAADGVASCVHVPMKSYQWAAFTSLAFNIGVSAFCTSSIASNANTGQMAEACRRIELYVYAGGKRVQGLVNRRAAERALCEGRV